MDDLSGFLACKLMWAAQAHTHLCALKELSEDEEAVLGILDPIETDARIDNVNQVIQCVEYALYALNKGGREEAVKLVREIGYMGN